MKAASMVDEVSLDMERRLPFAHAAGRGLKIAVIDSGVNLRHPHIMAPTRGVSLGFTGTDCNLADDKFGHGTAVTAAIQEKAPGAEYFAVKIFGDSLRTTTPRVIEAIEWCVDQGMDLVNLSLGTPNLEYREEMQSLIARAAAAGVVLIAARTGQQDVVLPGILDGVIGVDVDWSLPRDRYRIENGGGCARFLAPGFPRPLPGRPPERNVYGVSFAVANMTGFVARACEGLTARSPKVIRQIMAAEAERLESETPLARVPA
jgi:subtilisin family serine protease